MKNSPLTTMLLAVSAILVLSAVALCWRYSQNFSKLRAEQVMLNRLQAQSQSRQPAVNALISDLMNYSETHHDIQPILESAGITNRAGAKPSAK